MIKNYKYLILGAGPSGLTLAHALIMAGTPINEICVLEKNAVAGGLCRSEMVDGAPLDIGGGHFLDVKRKEVLDFLFRFMPREEWDLHDRVSKIRIRGMEVDHPLEANLWQFPSEVQADYLESIAQAGCVRAPSHTYSAPCSSKQTVSRIPTASSGRQVGRSEWRVLPASSSFTFRLMPSGR